MTNRRDAAEAVAAHCHGGIRQLYDRSAGGVPVAAAVGCECACGEAFSGSDEDEVTQLWAAHVVVSLPAATVDSGMSGASVERAEMFWANLPTGRQWASLATHEKALVCHAVNRFAFTTPAATEQEPVAWQRWNASASFCNIYYLGAADRAQNPLPQGWRETPLYAYPAPSDQEPERILKDAIFAIEKQKSGNVSYGGVLTDGDQYAWIEYSLRPQGYRPSDQEKLVGELFEELTAARKDLEFYSQSNDDGALARAAVVSINAMLTRARQIGEAGK